MSNELSERFLNHWAKRLKFFRYVKARGGFDGNIDKIILVLHFDCQEDILSFFDALAIPYKLHREQPSRPEPGKSYSVADRAKFLPIIPGTNWIEQPVWRTIDLVLVSVWGEMDRLKFTIVGPKEKHWRITDTEFENAERLENIFEKYSQRIIDPPIDSNNCLCPKYYPQYWKEG
jgi:hypothetical protein